MSETLKKQPSHYVIDAAGQTLGRVATRVAHVLQGKNRAGYSPEKDVPQTVRVTNLKQVVFTGKKFAQKEHYRFSGYPGGLKTMPLSIRWQKKPDEVMRDAVYQMLPANRLRRRRIKRMTIAR